MLPLATGSPPTGVLLLVVSLVVLCAAAFDWDWFMEHPKALGISRILTRNGARVFDFAIGLLFLYGWYTSS